MSSKMTPTDLVRMLSAIVNSFDALTEQYNLEKIKTIGKLMINIGFTLSGDAYLCVGGLPGAATSDHPERMLRFAIGTMQVVRNFNEGKLGMVLEGETQLNIRIGINTGL